MGEQMKSPEEYTADDVAGLAEALRRARKRPSATRETMKELGFPFAAGAEESATQMQPNHEVDAYMARGAETLRRKKAELAAEKKQRRAERRWRKEAAPCGTRTRAGTPCKRKPIYGKKRCANHGGLSTGPKTPEGRAKMAENMKKARAARRQERSSAPSAPTANKNDE
ncbi:MAG: HGGxSTG domain-containing protein [Pseudomonadota bacterium]